MKKIKLVLCITTLLSFFAISVNAAVTFLPNAGGGVGGVGGVGGGKKSSSSSPNNVSSKQQCEKLKYYYSATNCSKSKNLIDNCPHNSAYFRYCCDKEYMYTARECTQAGLIPGTSCGGLYKCR